MLEKTAEIERLMAPVLDGLQAKHLHAVLIATLCGEASEYIAREDDA